MRFGKINKFPLALGSSLVKFTIQIGYFKLGGLF